MSEYRRSIATVLESRLAEPPARLQILAGPRQVGKTTLVRQVLGVRPPASYLSIAADDPQPVVDFTSGAATAAVRPLSLLRHVADADWLQAQWLLAERRLANWEASGHPAVASMPFTFVIDEVQHVGQWSTLIKGLWDSAMARGLRMHVALLGSAPLLVQQGLNESLTGRYELIRLAHWSYAEMHDAFGVTLDQFVHFGGYPGAARYMADETRWRAYVRDSLIEPSIEKDVLAMARVDKPAMLRRLFELGSDYSGQIVSLDNVSRTLGQGHTLTLAHHLTLLSQAGLLSGLQKYAAQTIRQRRSPPKFQVQNNALVTAGSTYGFDEALSDRSHWGRMAESAAGAHLLNSADADTRVCYWREGDIEVDFVVEWRGRLAAIEIKTNPSATRHPGLDAFCQRHPDARRWLVGTAELPLGEFLRQPASSWTR